MNRGAVPVVLTRSCFDEMDIVQQFLQLASFPVLMSAKIIVIFEDFALLSWH